MPAGANVEASGSDLLNSDVRRRIVEHLSDLPRLAVEGRPTRDVGMTAAELGAVLGLHSTTVRFHLDQLVRGVLVQFHFVKHGGAGRPAKRYLVTDPAALPPASPQVEGPYQVLAGVLTEALAERGTGRRTPEEVGGDWIRRRLAEREPTPKARTTGEWVGKIGEVVDLLREWGYSPDLSLDRRDGDALLTLRDCPFIDLARQHPEIVCGVHLGLLRGALAVAGEEQAGVGLRPFVDVRTCEAIVVRAPQPAQETFLEIPGEEPGDPSSPTSLPVSTAPEQESTS